MAVGYEGIAYLDTVAVLCTGASIPNTRQRLEATVGYGGRLSSPISEIGIATPRVYDWTESTGSLDFELHNEVFSNVVKPWIFNRAASKTVEIKPRRGSDQQFSECYWSSIDLETSQNNVVTCSVGLVAMQRDVYTAGDNYIGNVRGQGGTVLLDKFRKTIPFWKTYISGISYDKITRWKLSFAQDISKIFYCQHNLDPIAPSTVGIGILRVTLEIDTIPLHQTVTVVENINTNVTLNLDANYITINNLELSSSSDNAGNQSDIVPISMNYNVYTLVS